VLTQQEVPLAQLEQSAQTAQLQATAIFALMALAVFVVGWYVARALTEPLLRLAETARAVGEGDYSARTEVVDNGEVGAVAATFDVMTERLQRQHLTLIGSLASAIDARDPYTAGHSLRVGLLSVELGRELGLPPASLEQLRIGGILHDIGKIGVRDAVLLKRGSLTPEERKLIEAHPTIGLSILAGTGLPREVLAIVGGHHEKLDGTGYPLGLSSDDLTVFPRIASVADVYDALTTDRPYRRAMTIDEAMDLLRREAASGIIDPDVVGAMSSLAYAWGEFVRTSPTGNALLRETLLRREAAA
jgi:putative nucleotidyltransferase with HDIG domain